MAVYDISHEGAEALRQLSNDMKSIVDELESAGTKLISSVSGVDEGLGEFASKIEEIVEQINNNQKKSREPVTKLTADLNRLASDVEEALAF